VLEDQEPTAQWPEDFQVLLFDYLEDMGIHEFPTTIPVKLVPIGPLLRQARQWEYGTGDNRADPSYQSDLTAYMDSGGKMPPLLVRGNKLLDGRHRLLALAGKAKNVYVIDLNDLKPMTEAEEPEQHLETRHRVRDQEALTRHYFAVFPSSFGQPNVDKGQDLAFSSGSRQFERENGVWYEIKRRKNPAYWDQPQYFFIAPGPGKLAFVIVKQPRRLKAALWHKACSQIWRDATGLSWYKDHPVVDGADEGIWQARAAGKKPEPAYEIFDDGTWRRVK
jgi:hypothetical protein